MAKPRLLVASCSVWVVMGNLVHAVAVWQVLTYVLIFLMGPSLSVNQSKMINSIKNKIALNFSRK